MLSTLSIKNIAVIEKAQIDFTAGLNILTGETGAGKSIIIDSINAILGERTSRELIRTGADSARITALFTDLSDQVIEQLNELGYECDEDRSLLLQRDLNVDGRGSVKINGMPATVGILKQVGRQLINIHGQHDSQALLSPQKHCGYLDRLGELAQPLSRYKKVFSELCVVKRELDKLIADEEDKSYKMDMLSFQIKELEKANLYEGEREELTQRRTVIQNSERIATAVSQAYESLNGTEDFDGIRELLDNTISQLMHIVEVYPSLNAMVEDLNEMSYKLEDHSAQLYEASQALEYDPNELEQIESRLDLIYRLSQKYGGDEAHMLQYLQKAKVQLETIETSGERIEQLEQRAQLLYDKARELADGISDMRAKAGQQFIQQVKQELTFLDMPNVSLALSHQKGSLSSSGQDKIEFLISTNAGEPPKPIAKIASGGELSRIMLAIKNVLADKDDIDTLIFDEIDTGISGRAAHKVGIKLRQTAAGRQIICVTHSAQISAQAHTHFFISKQTRDNRTFTDITRLDREGRMREIARITGGDQITELMLQNAAQMLDSVKD